jgi:diguanylate cyclase (GGDEF)-like protein/PAS domain S-box-containing protein
VTQSLSALLIEDNADDAELIARELGHAGFAVRWKVVDAMPGLRACLAAEHWDIVLSDHSMTEMSSAEALAIVKDHDPELPFVIVSGQIGEEAAAAVMRAGAGDYVTKQTLSRLGAVVKREIEEADRRRFARRRDDERRALYDITIAGNGLVDRQQFAHQASAIVRRFMDLDLAAVYWWDPARRALVLASLDGVAGATSRPISYGDGAVGRAFEQRQAVVVPDYATWEHAVPEHVGEWASVAAMPLPGRAEPLGVLVIGTTIAHAYSPEDIESLALFAGAIAPPLEIRALFDEAEQSRGDLQNRESHLRSLVETSPIAVVEVDAERQIRLWNPAAERMFGVTEGEILGKELPFIPDDAESEYASLVRRIVREGSVLDVETVLKRRDGTPIEVTVSATATRDEQDRSTITAFIQDSTERRQMVRELERQALSDSLTGLPNRSLLQDRLTQQIRLSFREGRSFALVLLDLDDFKEVNDTFGHHAGDELLRHLGQRLRSTVWEVDTVARLGGDEFAIVLPNTDEAGALRAIGRMTAELATPFEIESQLVQVGGSFGVVVYPTHGQDGDVLLRHADVAMYAAKREKSGFAVYSANQDTGTVAKLLLMTDLRRAVEDHDARKELMAHFQPIVDMASNEIVGFEALARWRHPERGLVAAGEFIPLAERGTLMKPLTRVLLNEAMRAFSELGPTVAGRGLSLNLSTRTLLDPDLPGQLAEMGRRYPLGGPLTLEITESTLMVDPERTIQVLTDLRRLGVRFAVDDFGVGYSSLAYLNRLPIDEVKIDRSFVDTLGTDPRSAVIVSATIDLAHHLGYKAVAEGVEREDTRKALVAMGCDLYQGYLLSPAIAPADLPAFMDRQATKAAPVLV